jgi:RNA polymerase sigma factor (sigma-70 family)
MNNEDSFERLLADMRPKLHRYCARMTGSAADGEDVVQDVLIKAVSAQAADPRIENPEGWLFRIAHNASLDFLRARARSNFVPLTDDTAILAEVSDLDVASVSFRAFLELPVLQRCAVVLKDVLGHTVEEIADVAGCTLPAAKSALQRGRQKLKNLAADGWDAPSVPLLPDSERRKLQNYVVAFQGGDFDTIRQMLADDVRLDLVNRLQWQGKKEVAPYFARYAEVKHWHFALGAVDGRAAMLVYDAREQTSRPAYFVVLVWSENKVVAIRDFLYAPYTMEACDWVRLDSAD